MTTKKSVNASKIENTTFAKHCLLTGLLNKYGDQDYVDFLYQLNERYTEGEDFLHTLREQDKKDGEVIAIEGKSIQMISNEGNSVTIPVIDAICFLESDLKSFREELVNMLNVNDADTQFILILRDIDMILGILEYYLTMGVKVSVFRKVPYYLNTQAFKINQTMVSYSSNKVNPILDKFRDGVISASEAIEEELPVDNVGWRYIVSNSANFAMSIIDYLIVNGKPIRRCPVCNDLFYREGNRKYCNKKACQKIGHSHPVKSKYSDAIVRAKTNAMQRIKNVANFWEIPKESLRLYPGWRDTDFANHYTHAHCNSKSAKARGKLVNYVFDIQLERFEDGEIDEKELIEWFDQYGRRRQRRKVK